MLSIKFTRTIDWFLYGLAFILIVIGLVAIYSISFGAKGANFFWGQLIFAILGLILMVVFSFLDYRTFKNISLFLYIGGIFLLILVLILGRTVFGATRWINLGFFQLQPSELFKPILVIIIANYLVENRLNISLKNVGVVILLTIIPTILVILQPDFGTAIIFVVTAAILLMIAGLRRLYFLLVAVGGSILMPILWFFILEQYQKDRLISFLNPTSDPFGTGYNVLQSTIAIGSGGLLGRGLGHGSQSQLNFLPAQHTDFIFAVIAEELGFLGAAILIAIFIFLIIRIIRIAQVARDDFGTLLATGIGTIFIFQLLINAGMNLGIMPITGIPLPLISYGGSSLIVTLISIGILQSIFIRHRKITF